MSSSSSQSSTPLGTTLHRRALISVGALGLLGVSIVTTTLLLHTPTKSEPLPYQQERKQEASPSPETNEYDETPSQELEIQVDWYTLQRIPVIAALHIDA